MATLMTHQNPTKVRNIKYRKKRSSSLVREIDKQSFSLDKPRERERERDRERERFLDLRDPSIDEAIKRRTVRDKFG